MCLRYVASRNPYLSFRRGSQQCFHILLAGSLHPLKSLLTQGTSAVAYLRIVPVAYARGPDHV